MKRLALTCTSHNVEVAITWRGHPTLPRRHGDSIAGGFRIGVGVLAPQPRSDGIEVRLRLFATPHYSAYHYSV